jgi:type II protein arginine methyltransferase
LEIGVDLDCPADVLIFDNVSSSLIADGVLPSTEQAVRRLLRPGAQIIPAKGTVHVALAEDRDPHRWRMQTVQGFDLSPFNRLAAPTYQMVVGSPDLILRSEPIALFHFDFQSGGPFPEARVELAVAASGGRVNGIAQWVSFDVDNQIRYENRPAEGNISAFAVMFYPLSKSVEMSPGEQMIIGGSHDRAKLNVWAQINSRRDLEGACC